MAKSFREYLESLSLFTFDTTTGQIIPQTDDVIDAIKSVMVDSFSDQGQIDVSDETPAGRIAETIAVAIKRGATVTAAFANQINPHYATGQMLDACGSLFSVKRQGASSTVISIVIAGTPNTVIPDGSLISDQKGNEFAIQGAQTIPTGGTVSARAVCTNAGPVEVENGTVTNIVSTVVGWSAVSNTATVSAGLDIESDEHYRNRVLLARWTGTAFVQAIRAEIERLENVDSVYVVENGERTVMYLKDDMTFVSTEPQSGKYILMQPNSVCIIVYGKTLSSVDYASIARTIYSTKSAGCGYTALDSEDQESTKGVKHVEQVQDDVNGAIYKVTFSTPVEISFGVDISVNRGTYSGTTDELEDLIKDAIVKWANGEAPFVDGLNLGQSIYAFEIGAAVSDIIPSIQISNVELSIGESSMYSKELFIYEIGILDQSSINVTVNG